MHNITINNNYFNVNNIIYFNRCKNGNFIVILDKKIKNNYLNYRELNNQIIHCENNSVIYIENWYYDLNIPFFPSRNRKEIIKYYNNCQIFKNFMNELRNLKNLNYDIIEKTAIYITNENDKKNLESFSFCFT